MNKEHTVREEFTKGLLAHNPLFVALLGMCPALA
ncbi:MAG: Rnf-Nqr domain containing protein, partial [Candidatus Brocadiales bacterium]